MTSHHNVTSCRLEYLPTCLYLQQSGHSQSHVFGVVKSVVGTFGYLTKMMMMMMMMENKKKNKNKTTKEKKCYEYRRGWGWGWWCGSMKNEGVALCIRTTV